MNLYTYVNFAEDEAKKPKKKSFLRKHWKKLALGAGLIGATALTGVAMAHHDKKRAKQDRSLRKLELQQKIAKLEREIAELEEKRRRIGLSMPETTRLNNLKISLNINKDELQDIQNHEQVYG